MTENVPKLEEWRKLYQAMNQVKEIAPWEWMEEIDMFGVQNPETEEPGFVSVMGMLGEYYAVAVYLGAEGLDGFCRLQELATSASPEDLLEIPQLQASFEDRDELHKKDYETIKKLKLKFRGKKAWPCFRSIRPGFAPWLLEAEEARFLRHVLEQTVDVALRFKDDPALLESLDDESYLVRVSRQEGSALIWEDRIMSVPPSEPRSIPIAMEVKMLEALKRMPKTNHKIEIDFFMLPTPIQEKGARPFFPYILLIVADRSGMILGQEVLQPVPSLETMHGLIPVNVVSQLAALNMVPKEMRVRADLLVQLLQPLAKELGIKLKQSRRLKYLDQAKESLFQHFVGQSF